MLREFAAKVALMELEAPTTMTPTKLALWKGRMAQLQMKQLRGQAGAGEENR